MLCWAWLNVTVTPGPALHSKAAPVSYSCKSWMACGTADDQLRHPTDTLLAAAGAPSLGGSEESGDAGAPMLKLVDYEGDD
jgi:hypothetical protein